MIRLCLFTLLLGIAACGQQASKGSEKVDTSHGISTDVVPATGFMTEVVTPPESATDSRGDGILRDKDGRPFGYGFLKRKLPRFEGTMIDGTPFDSHDLDKWLVIDVWGIWCGDCMADAPYVAALNTALAQDPKVDFMSIHVPPSAARADEAFGKYGSVEKYFESKGYSYPTLVDEDSSLRNALQIGWTPSYLLVSPDGVVRGYRTDLSVAGGEPVKDFVQDISRVIGQYETSLNFARAAKPVAPIGPKGAGELTGETVFTIHAIERAFPGFQVISDTVVTDVDRYPVFKVLFEGTGSPADRLVFTVEPHWDRGLVSSVITASNKARGPNGEQIGDMHYSDLSKAAQAVCTREIEGIVCPDPDAPHFVRLFESPSDENDNPTLAGMKFNVPAALK